jgi:hypothetical protein
MGDKAPTKRGRGADLNRPKGQGPFRLPLKEGRERPIIGAISLSQRFAKESCWWSDRDLIAALTTVNAARPMTADLVLCSGIHIFSEAHTETDATTARLITTAAGNRPVLMEWPSDDERNEWWLASGDQWSLVRHSQHIVTANQVGAGGRRVLEEIHDGYGVIQIGTADPLVLLICNEGRLLSRDPRTSAVASAVTRPSKGIPAVMKSSWGVLHPSHRPHHYRRARRGWDLLGRTKGYQRGIFEEVTSSAARAVDGTRAPTNVIHAGPWEPDQDWQKRAAVCRFRGGKRWRKSTPVHVPGLVEVLYAEFTV